MDVRADAAELVVICTPSGLHIGLAEEALAAGLHVVIEKPLDVDLARGRRIAELARAAAGRGILSTVISQHRFNPSSVVVDRVRRSASGASSETAAIRGAATRTPPLSGAASIVTTQSLVRECTPVWPLTS